MNLLTVYDTDFCNRRCGYCLSQQHNRHGKNLKPHFTAKELLDYVFEHHPPELTLIERTGGGEPCMHNEKDIISTELSKCGYWQGMRTNGTIYFEKPPNMKVVITWHDDSKPNLEKADLVFILQNPFDDWQTKQAHCEKHGIPYELKALKNYHADKCHSIGDTAKFSRSFIRNWTVIFPDGTVTGCNKDRIVLECETCNEIINDKKCKCGGKSQSRYKIQRLTQPIIKPPHLFCQPVINFERLFTDDEKQYLRERRDRYLKTR
jgi:organic radical activating enzyme